MHDYNSDCINVDSVDVDSVGGAVSSAREAPGGAISGGGMSGTDPRVVTVRRSHLSEPLGVTVVGGNFVGIFVRSVTPGSVLHGPKGLRTGDQILKVCY